MNFNGILSPFLPSPQLDLVVFGSGFAEANVIANHISWNKNYAGVDIHFLLRCWYMRYTIVSQNEDDKDDKNSDENTYVT